MKEFKGFTLAEVLITLGVIGVVAAMTMPSVINHFKEKQTVTALKHSYSVLSQAFTNIIANEGTPDTWNLTSTEDFRDLFAKYIRNTKKCDAENGACQPECVYGLHAVNSCYNYNNTAHSALMLNNGTVLTFWLRDDMYVKNCDDTSIGIPDSCMLTIHTDINGMKGPNTWGKDRFEFYVYKHRILPAGHPEMTAGDIFDGNCINGENGTLFDGHGCGAWVLYNENLDYLKCPEKLGWDKASSCK